MMWAFSRYRKKNHGSPSERSSHSCGRDDQCPDSGKRGTSRTESRIAGLCHSDQRRYRYLYFARVWISGCGCDDYEFSSAEINADNDDQCIYKPWKNIIYLSAGNRYEISIFLFRRRYADFIKRFYRFRKKSSLDTDLILIGSLLDRTTWTRFFNGTSVKHILIFGLFFEFPLCKRTDR